MEPVQGDEEEWDSEGRSGGSVAAQPLWWRRLTLLKGTELLCIPENPQLPPPAASLVRTFLVINSAFPEQGGWSLNLLYPWRETDHQSPLPLAAAGAQGARQGSGTANQGAGHCCKINLSCCAVF